uniref:Uncharacterized protein n=1 Tax=uncultured bacterium A1Q1_fos_500 TaxID=1256579 RepID=L7VWQ5_9BACT|nr:hypothetical protein [uncultured bacterium A1Q1_fos_500]
MPLNKVWSPVADESICCFFAIIDDLFGRCLFLLLCLKNHHAELLNEFWR